VVQIVLQSDIFISKKITVSEYVINSWLQNMNSVMH